MGGLLTQAEALDFLAPYLDDFRESVELGFAVVQKDPVMGFARKRTRANRMFDETTAELGRRAERHKAISVKSNEHSFAMSIGNRVVVHVKKLKGRGLASRGILTNARVRWLSQTDALEGTEITNLHLGYRLDELGQAIEVVALTCPLGRRNLWAAVLTPPVVAAESLFGAEDPLAGGTVVRSEREVATSRSVGEE